MANTGKHVDTSRATRRMLGKPGARTRASLAMVVCFVGFQGIVPQAGSADTSTLGAAGAISALSSINDAWSPTGSVGASLLRPLDTPDALDPMAPRNAPNASVHSKDLQNTSTVTAGNRPAAGSLFAPLAELVPTSSFGFRTSPITGEAGEFHTGQDYAAPCGTAVLAADAGTVRAVGWHPWGGGNRVEVDHGNGLITTYNHLQGISVRAGDSVNGGDPIAAIGTTGSSTGCHLHFETILDGEHVDPLRWKLVHTAPGTSKGELKDFSPGGATAADVPAWAQSSTRSDQSAPVGTSVPGAAGHPVADVVDSDAASRPSAGSGRPSTPDAQPVIPPAPPADASPRPGTKPETPKPGTKPESPKPESSAPSEPAPSDPAAPVQETPADTTPSCDIDPSAAPEGEESVDSQPPVDGVVLPGTEARPVDAVPITEPTIGAEGGAEEDAESVTPPCGGEDVTGDAESTPGEGDPATPQPGQPEKAEAPAHEQD